MCDLLQKESNYSMDFILSYINLKWNRSNSVLVKNLDINLIQRSTKKEY